MKTHDQRFARLQQVAKHVKTQAHADKIIASFAPEHQDKVREILNAQASIKPIEPEK